jgi:hypothetical protein
MDRRNSKPQMIKKIEQLNKQLEEVYDAGHWGIEYVGSANYAEREHEALNKLHIAMYGEGIYD